MSRTEPQPAALGALALSMAFVGTSMTANTFIVGDIPIMLGAFFRFALAVLVLLPFVWAIDGRWIGASRRVHLMMAGQAFFGVWVFNVLLLIGLDMTTATMSGIITATTPAMVAIFSWLLGDRLPPLAWLGVATTIAGVAVANLMSQGESADAPRPLLGAACVFGAVIGEALYTIFGREVARDLPPLSSTAWICLYGSLFFLPVAAWQLPDASLGNVPPSTWIAIAYLAVFVTVIAVGLWLKGLQTVPSSVAGAFTGVIPITALISAWFILDERIGWQHILAIACVIVGIALVARARGSRPVPIAEA